MKNFNLGVLLLAAAAGLLAWAAYDYFEKPITPENCGVTVSPKTRTLTLSASNAENRVPLKLINRSGRPIRIVGNNAC